MRSAAMMTALSLAGAACGVQADQAARGDRALGSAELTEAREPVGESLEDIGLLKKVGCTEDEYGARCQYRCQREGIACDSEKAHPYRSVADGKLCQCRGVLSAHSCWYYYDQIDESCVLIPGTGKMLCGYKGKP